MKKINFLTAGESHGKGLIGIIDGLPSGLEISEEDINFELKRRQMGFGRGARMKIENDKAIIYSGVRLGKTLGSPISILINNKDWKNWTDIMSVASNKDIQDKKITMPRPGHADFAGIMKYDFDDVRNVIERSSARETTMRVALGSICKKLLECCNIEIGSYVTSIYDVTDYVDYSKEYDPKRINQIADKSSVRSLSKKIEIQMINAIKKAQKEGNSVGGQFTVIVKGIPYGLGSYVQWNKKLNAMLSEAICSINAIKSVSFGLGESSSSVFGSNMHDEIESENKIISRTSNNAGGIEGGMSNAQPIIINATMKPLSTLVKPLKSIDIKTYKNKLAHKERTDSCAVPSASIIAEHMVALVLADALLDKFGGDSMKQLLDHIKLSAKY